MQELLALNMKKHEKLEKTRCQLKEEVANLRQHLEAVHNVHMMTYNQIERYKKEVEERAAQEINQKLQEVNLFLQVSEFVVYVCSFYYVTSFCHFLFVLWFFVLVPYFYIS